MLFIDKLYITMSVYIPHYIVGYVILNNIYRALYLRATGYDKWWLGLLPFGEIVYRRDVAGTPRVIGILQLVFTLLAIPGSAILWIPVWFLNSISNYMFGSVYLYQSNAVHYGFIPLYKYILMWKEIKICQKCSKAKSTSKKI